MALFRKTRNARVGGRSAGAAGGKDMLNELAKSAQTGDLDGVISGLGSTNGFMAQVFAAKLLPEMVGSSDSPAGRRATDALVAALDDVNPAVRSVAAASLGKIGDQRAVAALVGHMKDPDMSRDVGTALALIAERSKLGDELETPPTDPCPSNANGVHEWYSAIGGDELCALCGERVSKGKRLRCPYCSEMTPASDWPSYGDSSAFFNQTRERTTEEPGAYRIEASCNLCGEGFFVVWDRDPRPPEMQTGPAVTVGASSPSSGPAATPPALPNDALRQLASQVRELEELPLRAHISSGHLRMLPKLAEQVSWINGNLEAAASALESGIDASRRPITNVQIAAGLRQLCAMVKEPAYLQNLETAHPGVGAALEQHMAQLARIVADIEGPDSAVSRATALYSSSRGVAELIELCNARGILFGVFGPDFDEYRRTIHSEDYEVRGSADAVSYLRGALAHLRDEGESGSRALADLVRELLRCRSPHIQYALVVAADIDPTPELLDAIEAVIASPERAEAPAQALFEPGMVGGNRVGWRGHKTIVGIAGKAKAALEARV